MRRRSPGVRSRVPRLVGAWLALSSSCRAESKTFGRGEGGALSALGLWAALLPEPYPRGLELSAGHPEALCRVRGRV